MLNCTACVHRCIDSILLEAVVPTSSPSLHRALRAGAAVWSTRVPIGRRWGHTAAIFSGRVEPGLGQRKGCGANVWQQQRRGYAAASAATGRRFNADSQRRDSIASERSPGQRSGHRRIAAPEKKVWQSRKLETEGNALSARELRTELDYLRDPVDLANRVLQILREGQSGRRNDAVERVYDMVSLATKDGIRAVVSWNHLIDYLMLNKRVKEALKIYNAMKKRGQMPDSHTYGIMLKGLADNTRYPQALGTALTIYNSISADNSVVKVNARHTNTMLKVCARAGEIDTMFSIAGKLPVAGAGAADGVTFTTILNATWKKTLDDATQLERNGWHDRQAKSRDETVSRSLRMWEDIAGRWRAGDLWIDEDLVCAMGRTLLIGSSPYHWDDVFSLVQQTMNVPRQLQDRPLETGKQNDLDGQAEKKYVGRDAKELAVDGDHERSEGQLSPFLSQQVKHGTFTKPGNNVLSLLLEACDKRREWSAGRDYWRLLTSSPYNAQPDTANYHIYLRNLRRLRASAEATRIVCDQMAQSHDIDLQRKTFLIAMSTCIRDKNNPNVFGHGTRLVDLMLQKLHEPDVKTLRDYVELSNVTTGPHIINRGEVERNNVLNALDRFSDATEDIMSTGNEKRDGLRDEAVSTTAPPVDTNRVQKPPRISTRVIDHLFKQDKENTLDLIKSLIRSVDRLLEGERGARQGASSVQRQKELQADKAMLTRYVTSAMAHQLKVKRAERASSTAPKKTMTDEERQVAAEELAKKRAEEEEDREVKEWVERNLPTDVDGRDDRLGWGRGIEGRL